MERIILIETSTALCSAALAEDGKIVAYRESSAPKAHASLTAVFIQEMLQERGIKIADCDAVCVSMGPGSYTGLRVGVSTNVIPGPTGDLTPSDKSDVSGDSLVISSETEGRDEKSPTYKQITETAPAIIDENSFAEYLEQGPCLFIGDGAGKCADVIKHPNAHFVQCCPNASSMLSPALAAYRAGDFKDVAYFEPFYLKEFVATVSKKKLF